MDFLKFVFITFKLVISEKARLCHFLNYCGWLSLPTGPLVLLYCFVSCL